jgi:hypothetical protein
VQQALTKRQHAGSLLLIFNLTVWRFLLKIIKILLGEERRGGQPANQLAKAAEEG